MPFPNQYYSSTHPENLSKGLLEISEKVQLFDTAMAGYIASAAQDILLLAAAVEAAQKA